ncbi:MAG: Zn-dependent hydrolase [Deltaproteobacteria bacterium]|nr:Zn-dependent hydrolase [Deltaproteobacteria bacterium]
MSVKINLARLKKNIEELAEFGALETGGICRESFSNTDLAAKRWLMEKIRNAGLMAVRDEAGNIWGRLGSKKRSVLIGSHIDTVPEGGAFDGALGVLAGLECLETIRENELPCNHALEMVAFADEEGAFLNFLGSRSMLGSLDADEISAAKNMNGFPLAKAMADAGLNHRRIVSARRDPSGIKAYLELHIEQGPSLESAKIPIGIVGAIVGIVSYWVTFSGEANHAGTTPMTMRRDALSGATEFYRRINAWIRSNPGGVVTIGKMDVYPGAFNIVPGSVRLALEFRHSSATRLEKMESSFLEIGNTIAEEMGLVFTADRLSWDDPVSLSNNIIGTIRQETDSLGYAYRLMDSGAGHDAQILAQKIKAGMIFVPSVGGKSHCPEEKSNWCDIEKGVQLLLNSTLKLVMEYTDPK